MVRASSGFALVSLEQSGQTFTGTRCRGGRVEIVGDGVGEVDGGESCGVGRVFALPRSARGDATG